MCYLTKIFVEKCYQCFMATFAGLKWMIRNILFASIRLVGLSASAYYCMSYCMSQCKAKDFLMIHLAGFLELFAFLDEQA